MLNGLRFKPFTNEGLVFPELYAPYNFCRVCFALKEKCVILRYP